MKELAKHAPNSSAYPLLEPLRAPVFRALWIATIASNLGAWMQNVGEFWLMVSLTKSPILVALVETAGSLPVYCSAAVSGFETIPRRHVCSAQGQAAARCLGLLDVVLGEKAMSKLQWKLLAKKRGSSSAQGIPPGKEDLLWVTGTVTLIYGEQDAVLVDTFLAEQHAKELVEWVVASGKNLTTIYITHAHGDHFFGLKHLLDRFPNARAIATRSVVAAIQNQINPEYVQSFWEPRFPRQLPSPLVAPLDDEIPP